MKTVTIIVVDQYKEPVALAARVAIFQNNSLITHQITDEEGKTEFLLEEGTYLARVLLVKGAYASPRPQILKIEDDSTFEISIERTIYGAVADPNICVCGGVIRRVILEPIVFSLSHISGTGFVGGSVTDIFVPSTLVLRCVPGMSTVIHLPRKARFSISCDAFPTWDIVVPDLSSAPLQDVLFPILSGIDISTPSAPLQIGETIELSYKEIYTSGLCLNPAEEDSVVDQFLADNQEVAGITFMSSSSSIAVAKGKGVISITGVSTGKALISAEVVQLFSIKGAAKKFDLFTVEVVT